MISCFKKNCPLSTLLLLLFTSCLSEDPHSALVEDEAYTDATQLELATVANLYNYIGGCNESEGLQGTYRGVYDLNTFTTDEAMIPTRGVDWYDGGFWQALYTHQWTASDKALNNTWNYLFKVVVLCNRALKTLEKNMDLLSTQRYQKDVAEVRAVRALFYFYIMDLWGNVPILKKRADSLSEVTTSPRSEVFRFIVDELEEVEAQLPMAISNVKDGYYGRVTRPVAWFLLAKLYLNAGIYSHNSTLPSNPTEEQLNACLKYCNGLEELGYKLENDYSTNFQVQNEISAENIFTIPMNKYLYKSEFQNLYRSRHYTHGAALGLDAENGSVATLSTCATFGYDKNGGQPDTRWYLNFYSGNVYVDGMPVLLSDGSQLVYEPLEVKLDLTGSPYEKTAGARMSKYEVDRKAFSDGKLQNNDIVLFRYADVLLMRAEAKMRLGIDASDDVNAVRARVGMESIDFSTLSKEERLRKLLDERLLELVWEGWRRNDLIRFGLFHLAYDQRTPIANEAETGFTTLFPIPQNVIDLNPNGIKQNPGYE